MKQQSAERTPTAVHMQSNVATLADARLVDQLRVGDPVAFELIMRRYNRRLYRLARSVLRNGAEAEDVVQESYVRAYEKLDDFIGPNGFSAWLCRIAFNEALGRLRKRGRVISFDDYVKDADGGTDVRRIETMRTPELDPERLAASGELRRVLENAIEVLPDDFRVVFVLRAVEGMSVAETAECLSIAPETVKTRLHRARRLLQGSLGAGFDALMPSAFAFAGRHCDRIVATVFTHIGPSLEAARRHTNAVAKPHLSTPSTDPTSNPNHRQED